MMALNNRDENMQWVILLEQWKRKFEFDFWFVKTFIVNQILNNSPTDGQ